MKLIYICLIETSIQSQMNRVLLQLWEESHLIDGVLTDGCSLHLNKIERDNFVSQAYDITASIKPIKYDRVLCSEIPVFITDNLFEVLNHKKSLKLSEVEFRNLLRYEDIILNPDLI